MWSQIWGKLCSWGKFNSVKAPTDLPACLLPRAAHGPEEINPAQGSRLPREPICSLDHATSPQCVSDYVVLKAPLMCWRALEVAESGQKNRANSPRAPEKQKQTVPGCQDSDRRKQDVGPEPTLPSPWEELQSIEWAEQELGFPQRKGVQSYSEVAREILQGSGEGAWAHSQRCKLNTQSLNHSSIHMVYSSTWG